jgi:hypothetical protein
MMRPDTFGDGLAAVTQAAQVQINKALKEAKCKCNNRKLKRAMDGLRCQDDHVKSCTSNKKLKCCKTRADAHEHTTTSEKGPSKHLASIIERYIFDGSILTVLKTTHQDLKSVTVE